MAVEDSVECETARKLMFGCEVARVWRVRMVFSANWGEGKYNHCASRIGELATVPWVKLEVKGTDCNLLDNRSV